MTDPTGRPRETVTVDNGRVVVSTPPGEGFSMNPDQADFLAIAIHAASLKAALPPRGT